jgi:hypothetical protein
VNRFPDPILTVLGICGDLVIGRALVLLLRSLRYEARFLSASHLGEPASLEDVHLLLLTPTPELNIERRKTIEESLADAGSAAGVPILKLVTASVETEKGGATEGPVHVAHWPCRAEELEQRIRSILLSHPRKGLGYSSESTGSGGQAGR